MKREYYVNTLDMSWEDFEYYVKTLANTIKRSHVKISNIYGVPRGGIVVAVRLSHLLDKPLIVKWEDRNPNTLIVDDCVDSGQTLASPACDGTWKIAVLLYCPNSSVRPNYFSGLKSKTTWVIFPWEKGGKGIRG